MGETPRILSIQSHVVHGYVGNKSATFPLQLLGFEVDTINSVQFSNHTGYGQVRGQILTEKELDELVEGLAENRLDNAYTHLLTGYIGSASFLQRIVALVKALKEKNPNLIYVCDPVMGDQGALYVPADLLPIYRDALLPLADTVTPNQFETELLTGRPIRGVEDAWEAVASLHRLGCTTVALSSTELGRDAAHMICMASQRIDGRATLQLTLEFPKLAAVFTGTGDLFAALFLAWSYRADVKTALENTIATEQAILHETLKYATETGLSSKTLELKLIQCKKWIEHPHVTINAQIA